MDLGLLLKKYRHFLIERLDPAFGLTDKLISTKTLTVEEVNRINTKDSTTEDKNSKLIDCILMKGKASEFISALKDEDQIHLVNYLNSDGVYRFEFNEDWPLNIADVNYLDENRSYLLGKIVPTELRHELASAKVVNMWQLEFIESQPTDFDKNVALLNILRKCSIRQYKATIESLEKTNQHHIADALSRGNDLCHPLKPEDEERSKYHLTVTDGGYGPAKTEDDKPSSKSVVELGSTIEFEKTKSSPFSITWQQSFRWRTKNFHLVLFNVKGSTMSQIYLAVEDSYWNTFTEMTRDSSSEEDDWRGSCPRGELTVTKQFRYGQNNEGTFRFLVLGDKSDNMYQHRFATTFQNYNSQDTSQNILRAITGGIDWILRTKFITQLGENYIGHPLREF